MIFRDTGLTGEDGGYELFEGYQNEIDLFNRTLEPLTFKMSDSDKELFKSYIENMISSLNQKLSYWMVYNRFEDINYDVNFVKYYEYEPSNEKILEYVKTWIFGVIGMELQKWLWENQMVIYNNFKSILLSLNDNYNTERTYTINKNDSSNSTYKEGFNGGGLANQQGTKLSNSSTNSNTLSGTDTDKYSQTDTLRQLNYLQLLNPINFDSYIEELNKKLFVPIWSSIV